MICTVSMDSIHLEDSDKSTEEIIQNIVNKKLGDKLPSLSELTLWRKRVVHLIGSYLMTN